MKRFILVCVLGLLMSCSCAQAQQCRNGVCYAPAQQSSIQVQSQQVVTYGSHSHTGSGVFRGSLARVGKFLRRR